MQASASFPSPGNSYPYLLQIMGALKHQNFCLAPLSKVQASLGMVVSSLLIFQHGKGWKGQQGVERKANNISLSCKRKFEQKQLLRWEKVCLALVVRPQSLTVAASGHLPDLLTWRLLRKVWKALLVSSSQIWKPLKRPPVSQTPGQSAQLSVT